MMILDAKMEWKGTTVDVRKECDGKVIIIENFMLPDELSQLSEFMRTFDYEGMRENDFKYWGKRLINQHQLATMPGYENKMDNVLPLLTSMLDRTSQALNTYDHEAQWRPSPYNLIRMFSEGGSRITERGVDLEMFIHIDNQGHMEQPIMWGSVAYLNDDYEGGEIYYPDYEFWYKPKAGAMVFHEGNTRHGVKAVLSGNRYCAASLVTIDGHFNQNPLPTSTGDPDRPYHYPGGYWGKRLPDDPIQGDVKIPRSDGSFAPYNDSPTFARGT